MSNTEGISIGTIVGIICAAIAAILILIIIFLLKRRYLPRPPTIAHLRLSSRMSNLIKPASSATSPSDEHPQPSTPTYPAPPYHSTLHHTRNFSHSTSYSSSSSEESAWHTVATTTTATRTVPRDHQSSIAATWATTITNNPNHVFPFTNQPNHNHRISSYLPTTPSTPTPIPITNPANFHLHPNAHLDHSRISADTTRSTRSAYTAEFGVHYDASVAPQLPPVDFQPAAPVDLALMTPRRASRGSERGGSVGVVRRGSLADGNGSPRKGSGRRRRLGKRKSAGWIASGAGHTGVGGMYTPSVYGGETPGSLEGGREVSGLGREYSVALMGK